MLKQRSLFTARQLLKGGNIRDIEVISGPIRTLGKDLMFSIIRDITDRKQAEEKVAEQLIELRRWYEVTLGRENRILDLKQEVDEALKQAGLPPRYSFSEADPGV